MSDPSRAQDRFEADPIGALEAMGAVAGPERRIQTLYRVRSGSMVPANEVLEVFTVGYPMFITTATTRLTPGQQSPKRSDAGEPTRGWLSIRTLLLLLIIVLLGGTLFYYGDMIAALMDTW